MTELAEAIASLVGPYLPVLVARGETLLEEAEIALAPDLRKRAQTVWDRLNPSVSARPSAASAARLVAQSPEDESARAAFRLQIEDILKGDSTLAEEVRELVEADATGEVESLADAAVRDLVEGITVREVRKGRTFLVSHGAASRESSFECNRQAGQTGKTFLHKTRADGVG